MVESFRNFWCSIGLGLSAGAIILSFNGHPGLTVDEPLAEESLSILHENIAQPIPVLTGTEMSEQYGISRFIDADTDYLCYVTEANPMGVQGSPNCTPRPSSIPRGSET